MVSSASQVGILRNPAARLRLESLKTPAEKAVAAQAHKASVMIAFNLTSVKRCVCVCIICIYACMYVCMYVCMCVCMNIYRAMLLERGLSRALVCVVEAETPTLCLSAASALHAELALKGLYNLGKASCDSWYVYTHTHTLSLSLSLSLTHTHTHTHTHRAHELTKDGMLTAACAVLCMSAPQSLDGVELEGGVEAAKARCVGAKLLVLRALMRAVHDLSKSELLASVLLDGAHVLLMC